MRIFTSSWPRSRRTLASAAALAAVVAAGGVGSASAASGHKLAERAATSSTGLAPFTIVSRDFHDGGRLPVFTEYGGVDASEVGCSGKNLAPELNWFNAPSGTAGYALLVNDMDAPLSGGWHHYVVYNIPGAATTLPGHGAHLYTEGATSWDVNGIPAVGWGGPCPPANGQIHHYIFTLYALSTATIPGSNLTYEDVLSAIAPYVVGSTVIIGTFHLPLSD